MFIAAFAFAAMIHFAHDYMYVFLKKSEFCPKFLIVLSEHFCPKIKCVK